MKAMDKWRNIVEEIKLEYMRKHYNALKNSFSQWSSEFNSGNAPEEREVESILASGSSDIDVMAPEVD